MLALNRIYAIDENEMIDDFKKLLMDTLKNKPSNKALMLFDFSVNVRSTLGVSMNDHLDELSEAATLLQDEKYIRFEDGRQGGRFVRGLHFDDYFDKKTEQSVVNFSVGSVSGGNVQIGNNNSLVIEQGLKSLIDKIDSKDIPEPEKEVAKNSLKSLLSNPTVAAILGGAASGILSLL